MLPTAIFPVSDAMEGVVVLVVVDEVEVGLLLTMTKLGVVPSST